MAIVNCSSFDAQVVNAPGGGGATTALTNRKLFDSTGGTPPTLDTTTFLHGTASAKCVAAAASSSALSTTLNALTTSTSAGWFRVGAGTISIAYSWMRYIGGVTSLDVRLDTTGILYLSSGTIDGSAVAILTPATGTWYWITHSVDYSANPNVHRATVYNTSYQVIATATRSVAVAADATSQFQLGNINAGRGVDTWCDSFVLTDSATALAPRKVQLLSPTNGTHSFTANDFQDQASGNLTTASDIASLVDDYPPSLSDFVKQVVIRAAGYAEFQFSDLVTTGLGAAEYVQLCIASHPVGTANANTSIMRLVDGGTVTAEAIADMTAAADTLEYHRHGYNTAPSTSGAWTNTLVNALLARWGYADDVTPPPALDSIWLEVVSPITLPTSGKKAKARMSMGMAMSV